MNAPRTLFSFLLIVLLSQPLFAEVPRFLVGFDECDLESLQEIAQTDISTEQLEAYADAYSPTCYLALGLLVGYDRLITYAPEEADQVMQLVYEKLNQLEGLDPLYQGQWMWVYSNVKLRKQEFLRSWEWANRAELLEVGHPIARARILHQQARVLSYRSMMGPVKAKLDEVYQTALSESATDSLWLCAILSDYGNYFSGIGKIQVGLDYANQALDIAAQGDLPVDHPTVASAHLVHAQLMAPYAAAMQDTSARDSLAEIGFASFEAGYQYIPVRDSLRRDELLIIKAIMHYRLGQGQAVLDILNPLTEKYLHRTDAPATFASAFALLGVFNIDFFQQPAQGLSLINKGIELRRAYDFSYQTLAPLMHSKGVAFSALGQLDSAAHYFQLSQRYNSQEEAIPEVGAIPTPDQIGSWSNWLQIQGSVSEHLLEQFQANGKPENIKRAYAGLQTYWKYLPLILAESDDRLSSQYLGQVYQALDILVVARQGYGLSDAGEIDFFQEEFLAAEHNHSIGLWRQSYQGRALAAIPAELQASFEKWKRELQSVKTQLSLLGTVKVQSDAFPTRQRLEAKAFHLRRRIDSLRNHCSETYPAFRNQSSLEVVPAISQLQSRLRQHHQTLISYYLPEQQGFQQQLRIFILTGDQRISLDVSLPRPLHELVAEFRTRLLPPAAPTAPAEERAFLSSPDTSLASISHQLYQLLLAPVADTLGTAMTERLVIIPHQSLELLPFPLLLSDLPSAEEGYQSWPFLLKQTSVAYGYSAAKWYEASQSSSTGKGKDFVMSPLFERADRSGTSSSSDPFRQTRAGDSLYYLDNHFEARAFSELIPGSKWIDELTATKAEFLQLIPSGRIVHLATHAYSHPDTSELSYIAFANPDDLSGGDLLYLPEIYGLSTTASLISLSACETGIGQLKKGDGAQSLGRALRTIGAQSIISSQWKVPDQESDQIMTKFYENLAKGMTKEESLRQAQIAMIETRSHPYFWGAFGLYGNAEPMEVTRPSITHWVWAGLLISLVGLLFFLWMRRQGPRQTR